jgi:hypothetical protein
VLFRSLTVLKGDADAIALRLCGPCVEGGAAQRIFDALRPGDVVGPKPRPEPTVDSPGPKRSTG